MPDGGNGLNRAERRRIERLRRKGLEEFHAAAGGAIELRLVRTVDAPTWMFAAGPIAAAFRQMVVSFYDNLTLQSCLICGHDFAEDRWACDWVLVMPLGHPAPTDAMISGICGDCSGAHPDDAAMLEAAAEALRRYMWPDLRRLDTTAVTGDGGRA
jgi:hypothetical protein